MKLSEDMKTLLGISI